MGFNKKFFTTGGIVASSPASAAFDPLQNFETVTYTGNGGTQKITGYIRKGAAFNGSSSYITTSLDFNTLTNYSISLWIYIQATPSASDIFAGTIQDSGALNGFYLSVQTDRTIRFFERNSSTNASALTSTDTINAGSWNHILVVRNGSTNLLYINDGTAVSTSNGTITHAEDFTIGRGGAHTSGLFEGKIDQVRVFNKALDQDDVDDLYLETYADPKKSTTDYFGDDSGIALYELDDSANDTGGTSVVFTTWDSTLSPIPNYSEDNLRMTGGAGNLIGYSKDIITSGKWYWEHEVISIGGESSFGISRPNDLGSHYVVGTSSTSWGLYVNGNLYHNNSLTTSGYMSGGFANGDIIGVELDLDNGTIEFYKNGVGYGNAFTGLTGEFIVAAESRTTSGINDHRTNFGQFAWDYTPSTGFIGIPSKYNGTDTNVNYLGMAFQPDLVWIKARDNARHHRIFDSVRGENARGYYYQILSSTTEAESTYDSASWEGLYGGLTSLDSNGFTVKHGTSTAAYPYNGSENYVAWCWKAGGADVLNEEGTTDSQVSANVDAGFSIVKYTGTLSSAGNVSVGHGLSQPPELIISKRIDSTGFWRIRPFSLNNNPYDYLEFDTGALAQFSAADGVMALPTSTTFDNNWNSALGGAGDVIAYCFHSVDGYQKVGSYVGTNAPNNVVTTGFRPRWIMIKSTGATNGDWNIFDTVRENEPLGDALKANTSSTEGTEAAFVVDITDTGFELDGASGAGGTGQINSSGITYIYLAIA